MSNFFKSDLIRELAVAEDQKAAIVEALGDSIHSQTLTGNDMIIAVYIEKAVNRGGIIMPDERLKESLYQSKVGLVVKAGPDAFRFRGAYPWVSPYPDECVAIDYINSLNGKFPAQDDENWKQFIAADNRVHEYNNRVYQCTPKVGDWVVHFPTDSKLFGLRGVPCRYSLDSTVKMITTAPDEIL